MQRKNSYDAIFLAAAFVGTLIGGMLGYTALAFAG